MSESTMGQVKTDDLISRRAAIKAIDDLPNCYNGYSDAYDKAYIIGALEELSGVEPKKVVEDYCIPRNLMVVAAEDFHRLVEQMLQTIDVPDRKFGEWITEYDSWGGLFKTVRAHKCSICGHYLDFDGVNAGRGDANYCPNCGARMERSEE